MMAERHRLRALQMREAGHDAVGMLLGAVEQRVLQRGQRRHRPDRSRRAPTAGNRSRPDRCGCARCAAARRPGRSARRSRASVCMWMSSSARSSGDAVRVIVRGDLRQPGGRSPPRRRPRRCPARRASRHAPCDPAMSCRHKRLSNGIEAFISRITAAGPFGEPAAPHRIGCRSCLSDRRSYSLLLLGC